MIDTEIVYNIEQPRYIIVDSFMSNYKIQIKGFLIIDDLLKRYNFYIIFYDQILPRSFKADYIVQTFTVQRIEVARQYYPQYNFDDNNYGF